MPSSLPPTLNAFSEQLDAILSEESSESLQQSQQHLTHLFDTLIDVIANIQAKQPLSYDEDLYIKRIIYADFSGDSLPEGMAQQVEQILERIADPTSCLKQRLFHDVLEPFSVQQTLESSLPPDRTVSLSEGGASYHDGKEMECHIFSTNKYFAWTEPSHQKSYSPWDRGTDDAD